MYIQLRPTTSYPIRLGAPLNHVSSEVFSSTDQRIVVISRWHGEPAEVPEAPAGLSARSAHAWDFTPVDR